MVYKGESPTENALDYLVGCGVLIAGVAVISFVVWWLI